MTLDTNELRRLAQAALAAPDGLSAEWMDRLGQFQEAADASVVSELLDRLEAAESDALEQSRLNGMGASREAALMAKLEAAEKERDALRAKIEAMEQQSPFTYIIQHLNSNPYSLTKDECVTLIKELRDLYNADPEAKP